MQFIRLLKERGNVDCRDYAELHHWSVTEKARFWQTFFEFAQITHSRGADNIYQADTELWQEKWFAGCRLNFAENMLRYRDERDALRFLDESGVQQKISYRQLYEEVARIAGWLKSVGIVPGDRIAGFAANRIETVIAMLASASLGAVWSSCSPACRC